jgi:hypothetical protein
MQLRVVYDGSEVPKHLAYFLTYNNAILPISSTKRNSFLITEAHIATAQQQF